MDEFSVLPHSRAHSQADASITSLLTQYHPPGDGATHHGLRLHISFHNQANSVSSDLGSSLIEAFISYDCGLCLADYKS